MKKGSGMRRTFFLFLVIVAATTLLTGMRLRLYKRGIRLL